MHNRNVEKFFAIDCIARYIRQSPNATPRNSYALQLKIAVQICDQAAPSGN
jgi:hypothetical protein